MLFSGKTELVLLRDALLQAFVAVSLATIHEECSEEWIEKTDTFPPKTAVDLFPGTLGDELNPRVK